MAIRRGQGHSHRLWIKSQVWMNVGLGGCQSSSAWDLGLSEAVLAPGPSPSLGREPGSEWGRGGGPLHVPPGFKLVSRWERGHKENTLLPSHPLLDPAQAEWGGLAVTAQSSFAER